MMQQQTMLAAATIHLISFYVPKKSMFSASTLNTISLGYRIAEKAVKQYFTFSIFLR